MVERDRALAVAREPLGLPLREQELAPRFDGVAGFEVGDRAGVVVGAETFEAARVQRLRLGRIGPSPLTSEVGAGAGAAGAGTAGDGAGRGAGATGASVTAGTTPRAQPAFATRVALAVAATRTSTRPPRTNSADGRQRRMTPAYARRARVSSAPQRVSSIAS